MLVRFIQKIRRARTSKPVTQGWVKYRGLMTAVNYAAERNYVLTLFEQDEDRLEVVHILIAYLDGQMTVDEVEAELGAAT